MSDGRKNDSKASQPAGTTPRQDIVERDNRQRAPRRERHAAFSRWREASRNRDESLSPRVRGSASGDERDFERRSDCVGSDAPLRERIPSGECERIERSNRCCRGRRSYRWSPDDCSERRGRAAGSPESRSNLSQRERRQGLRFGQYCRSDFRIAGGVLGTVTLRGAPLFY